MTVIKYYFIIKFIRSSNIDVVRSLQLLYFSIPFMLLFLFSLNFNWIEQENEAAAAIIKSTLNGARDWFLSKNRKSKAYLRYVAVGLHVTACECECVWFTYEIAMSFSIHKSMALLWCCCCGWDNWPFQWLLSCHMEMHFSLLFYLFRDSDVVYKIKTEACTMYIVTVVVASFIHSSIWAQSILVWQLTRTGSVYNEVNRKWNFRKCRLWQTQNEYETKILFSMKCSREKKEIMIK